MKHRIHWIDFAKSLAIFMVVVIHTHCSPIYDKGAKAMIIPTFLLMSGFLFSYEKNPRFRDFSWKRFRQLVFPYYWMSALTFVAWYFVLRHFGEDAASPAPAGQVAISMLLSQPPGLVCNVPLWSFFCFFLAEMFFYPLGRRINPFLICAGVWLVVWAVDWCGVRVAWLPFSVAPAFCGVGFYALGWGVRKYVPEPVLQKVIGWQGLLVALPLFLLSVWFNSKVSFYICYFGNFPLFLLGAVAGAVVLISLCSIVSRHFIDNRAIRFVSVGTLIVCGFHMLMFPVLKGIAFYGFGLEPWQLTDSFPKGLCFALLAFLLTMPVIYILRRWFRPLIDK